MHTRSYRKLTSEMGAQRTDKDGIRAPGSASRRPSMGRGGMLQQLLLQSWGRIPHKPYFLMWTSAAG
jgi:hypothetical protein